MIYPWKLFEIKNDVPLFNQHNFGGGHELVTKSRVELPYFTLVADLLVNPIFLPLSPSSIPHFCLFVCCRVVFTPKFNIISSQLHLVYLFQLNLLVTFDIIIVNLCLLI